MRMNSIRRAAFCCAASIAAFGSFAQGYPNKPVRVVEGFPPGGPSDVIMRLLGDRFQKDTGFALVVENKPGAGGHIATQEVARAAPDGYTLLSGADTQLTVNPHIYRNSSAGLREKIVPVALLSVAVMALACDPRVPATNVKELVALSKTRDLKYGSGGAGSPAHLTMEILMKAAGGSATHVPYRGPAASVSALLGGEVDCVMGVSNVFHPFWRDRKIVILGLSGTERNRLFPEIASFAEQGFREQSPYFYSLIAVPAGTPQAAVDFLQAQLQKAIGEPEVRDRLLKADIASTFIGQAEAQRIVREQSDRFQKAIAETGLKVE